MYYRRACFAVRIHVLQVGISYRICYTGDTLYEDKFNWEYVLGMYYMRACLTSGLVLQEYM